MIHADGRTFAAPAPLIENPSHPEAAPLPRPFPLIPEGSDRSVKGFLQRVLRGPWFYAKGVGLTLLVVGVCAIWFMHFDASLAKLIERNAFEALFIGTEMRTESGPDFVGALAMHKRLMGIYIEGMRQAPNAKLLKRLYPEFDPGLQLEAAREILNQPATSNKEAKRMIRDASKVVTQYAGSAHNFASNFFQARGILMDLQPCPLPPGKFEDADGYIGRFQESLNEFVQILDMPLAEKACMDSRLATLAVVRLLPEYVKANKTNTLVSLSGELSRLASQMTNFASTLQKDDDRSRASSYAKNVERRKTAIDQALAKKFQSAHNTLQAAPGHDDAVPNK